MNELHTLINFNQGVLDSLSAHIAVLDKVQEIVAPQLAQQLLAEIQEEGNSDGSGLSTGNLRSYRECGARLQFQR
ncbi:MAG: hypothetical protein R3E79_56850 [Caldilineaceae bacterium]